MHKAFLIGVVACCLAAAADAPYAGKWKMNVAKSDFGETTLTYEPTAGGAMKATMDGQSYTFKTDGKDNMTPWGMTAAWKAVDAGTWETTEKTNGKVTSNSTLKVSPDGKTLTIDAKRVKADGGTSTDSMTFQRVSGGPGLSGKWRTRKMNSSSPETMSLTPKGSDGLTISYGNIGAACDARFDGKAYPATGPLWPAGWTCTIARHGANAFDVIWKKDGKDMYRSTLTASPDGKTLTEDSSAAAASEKVKIVYDRQ